MREVTTAGTVKPLEDDLAPGTRIGRYRIEHPVGRGGMGTVYAAYDETTNRNVAVKLLAKGIPATLRERFLAECEAEANIRHEHVMPVYDRGWLTDEQPYFVMELLYEPITLSEIQDLIDQAQLGSTHPRLRHWNDVRRLIADVLLPICEGVHVANAEYGVQHRDLKPDNVLIDIRTRRAYLIDFGICREMDDRKDVGKIVGTPRFLSPEQAGGRVDPRTDVWGLGALLRYVVTGEPPIRATSPFTRIDVQKRVEALKVAEAKALEAGEEAKARGYAGRRAQLEDPNLRVQDDLFSDAKAGVYEPLPEGTSAGLAAIINKAMAPASADRYETAGDLARDLSTWIKGGGVSALAEAGARGAAVDWAKRLLNRNVVRGGGALTALAVGFLLGTGLFTQTPPAPDHRAEDAVQDLERLDDAFRDLATLDGAETGLGPLAVSSEHALLSMEAGSVSERARAASAQVGASPLKERLDARLAGLVRRMKTPTLTLDGWDASPFSLSDLAHVHAQVTVQSGMSVQAPPGAYLVEGANGALRARVLLSADPADSARHLGLDATEVPVGLRWVPAGTAGANGAPQPAFIADPQLVTNDRYSEWLDDLSAGARAAVVPATGFRQSPSDPTRWLVAQDMGSKPVRGVSARNAAAYAAWRSNVEGVTYRLPTDAQWQRMAGIDQAGSDGADALFPWRAAVPWRMRHRRGEDVQPVARARDHFHESPCGFKGLYTGPGEIARSDDGAGYVLKGRGGILPSRGGIARSEPLAPDARDHGYGFRLVIATP